jgi:transcriptional regulator with XRE-family HTH domain
MSEMAMAVRGRLRVRTAEEIRVLLARRRISAAELARRTGMKQSTLARRMTGETAFDLDDLELIADVLGVTVTELLPQFSGPSTTTPYVVPAKRPATQRPADKRPKTRTPDGPPNIRRTARLTRAA